ncbi:hypothetical protein [Pyxidicoccus trucidator]|uniref:hypothetical protein n=1 Tax=Pyxidicoccus trucidator TaxID=2709662 RepID=UPI0013D94CEF|nr:hypothetical protein [Pyxidicoccus trucidator]
MSESQVRDASKATFEVLTEKGLAERRRKEGARVIEHGGRPWEEMGAPGFFQPVHLLARLRPEQATRPTRLSWGYRAALRPEDANAANGSIPVMRLADLERYDVNSLSSSRRNRLRKCQRLVRVVQLTGPDLLEAQGYELVVEALSRTRHRKPPSRADYVAEVRRYFQDNHWCVLAGLIDDRLGGFRISYAVDGVAYSVKAYYATWALPTNISTGLVFEFAQLCRRTPEIRLLVSGQHSREDAQLRQFKEDMGFVLEHMPSRWNMNVLAQAFIRWKRPHAYYRLTGRA